MKLPFATRGNTVLASLEPYVVATGFHQNRLDLAPFGLPIRPENRIDPLRTASDTFLSLLQRLDVLTFGPEGMPMPRWVFYDCAELPGAIYGLGRPVEQLWPGVAELMQLPAGYRGLVPCSMYVALPLPRRGVWIGHNLCSLAPVLRKAGVGDDLGGLATVTKALALRCFRVHEFWGVTQWDSAALFIHCKFGPLRLATAWTPAHSEPETLTYGFDVNDLTLRAALGDASAIIERPQPGFWVDSTDREAMQRLQAEIEAGGSFAIPSAPEHGTRIRVPVSRQG